MIASTVPPGTPPPSPPPGGPTHPPSRCSAGGSRPDTTRPIPTPRPAPGPGRLVADAERQLSRPLHLLAAAVLELDCDPATRTHLNAAAQHVSLALTRLARIETPARRDQSIGAGPIARTGGPVHDLARSVEGPTPGGSEVDRLPGVGFAEGRHRLIGAATYPDGTPPFPGSPPGPPPPSPS